MEEGLLEPPSFGVIRHKNDYNGDQESHGSPLSESPSITITLVLSTFVAVCASFTSGCSAGYSSPAESGIVAELGLSTAQFAVFGSLVSVGGIVGALTCGKLADFIGRRWTLWVSEIFCSMGWFAIAFAKNAWWIYIGRLLIGCGLGLITYVVPVYVAEITPKNIRGAFTSTSQLMLCLGFALMYFVGTIVNWRLLAVLGSASGFIQIVGLFFIPESPRWLEMTGREEEFMFALQRLRGKTADITEEANEIRDKTKAFQQLLKTTFIDLFQRRYAHSLTVGVGLAALQQFCGVSAIAFYTSEIFDSAGFSTSVGCKSIAIFEALSSIVGVILIDKCGRRPLLLVSVAGVGLSCCLMGVSFLLQDLHQWTKITPILVFIGLMVCTASFPIGLGGVPWLIMSEIYPINMKGSAGSLVSISSWICAWISTYSFTFIFEWSSTGTFFMFVAICGLTFIFVAKLVPETKGRSLEEIQASMTHLI